MKLNIQKFTSLADKVLADNTAIDATSLDYDVICPTPKNVIDMTIVANDETYPFSYDSTTKAFTNTNQNVDGGYAEIILTAPSAIDDLYFFYTVDTESGYDELHLQVGGGEDIYTFSGAKSGELSLGAVTADTQILVYYSKDGSVNSGTDTVTFSFGTPVSGDQESGLYQTTDKDGDMYFFRGAVTNNYVGFNGHLWRILRINGDKTVTLIYDGSSAAANGVQYNGVTLGKFNINADDNAYVGLKYTLGELHGKSQESSVYTTLKSWITSNLWSSSYFSLNKHGRYEVDRRVSSGTGLGTDATIYQGKTRILDSEDVQPISFLENEEDIFTMTNANNGNLSLDYSVGLPTADDLVRAGYLNNQANIGCYLYRTLPFWTQTPSKFEGGKAWMIATDGSGGLTSMSVDSQILVRPVITLKAEVQYSYGSGTSSSPYYLSTLIMEQAGKLKFSYNGQINEFFTPARAQVPYRGRCPVTPKAWSMVEAESDCVEDDVIYFIFGPVFSKLRVNISYDSQFSDVSTRIYVYSNFDKTVSGAVTDLDFLYLDTSQSMLQYSYPIKIYPTSTFTATGSESSKMVVTLTLRDAEGNIQVTADWDAPTDGITYNPTSGSAAYYRPSLSGDALANWGNLTKALIYNPTWYAQLDIVYTTYEAKACLVEGTQIKTINSTVAIEDLKVGDSVIDQNGNETEIIKTYSHKTPYIYTITLNDNYNISCTYDHQFIQSNGEIITAEDIVIGTQLLALDGEQIVTAIEKVDKAVNVYEIVTTTNNYALANNIICECEQI